MLADQQLVDRLGIERAGRHLMGEGARCRRDLAAAAIGQRDGQLQPGVVARQRLAVLDQRDDVRGEAGALADDAQAHAVAVDSAISPRR